MKLILVRHGETQLNRDGRVQGMDNARLTVTGRKQARAVAEALAADMPFHLYASPLVRAMETAQVIAECLHTPLAPLRGLEEIDTGELSGLTGQEMRQRYPELMGRWAIDASTVKIPGGESMVEVKARAWRAIAGLADRHAEHTVVAVSHHFAIAAIVSTALDMSLRHFRRLRHDLGAISRLDLRNDEWVLVTLNETWHLGAIPPEGRETDDG